MSMNRFIRKGEAVEVDLQPEGNALALHVTQACLDASAKGSSTLYVASRNNTKESFAVATLTAVNLPHL